MWRLRVLCTTSKTSHPHRIKWLYRHGVKGTEHTQTPLTSFINYRTFMGSRFEAGHCVFREKQRLNDMQGTVKVWIPEVLQPGPPNHFANFTKVLRLSLNVLGAQPRRPDACGLNSKTCKWHRSPNMFPFSPPVSSHKTGVRKKRHPANRKMHLNLALLPVSAHREKACPCEPEYTLGHLHHYYQLFLLRSAACSAFFVHSVRIFHIAPNLIIS